MNVKTEFDEIYHIPDIRFAKWCEMTFSVNRGVIILLMKGSLM
ncbi:hypothetical protein [Lysinibacillus sp. NPDC047702]